MKIKRFLKKVKKYMTDNQAKAHFRYTKYYENEPIIENEILIQSYDGSSISGNPYYLLLELCNNEKYANFNKIVVTNSKTKKSIIKQIKEENLSNVSVVNVHSKKYCKILARAKYLINNATFPVYFIKKERQVYLNTWHGTPLKAMGKDIIETPHELGSVQRNFMMSDYMLYQNDFMFEKMKSAFMLDNLCTGKYVISGYPRNDIFFNKEERKKVKEQLDLTNKKVIVYMPTWRGTIANKQNDEQENAISNMINTLEKELDDDTVVYLKIHNLAKVEVDYKKLKKIKPFPKGYETYRFLNIADCLITDYSSVMFDFANSGKKIVLYTYDFDDYVSSRGFYIDMKELPFPMVNTLDELCEELKDLNSNVNYEQFKKDYCSYDSIDTSKKVCDLLFNNKESDLKILDGNNVSNNKENILIFSGALLKNGITSSLKGLINNIDLDKYNYYLTFYRNAVRKNCATIRTFPKECNYIPIQGSKDYTIKELINTKLYFKYKKENESIRKSIERVYRREIKRIYPNLKFKYVIDFSGYDKQPMNMIGYMDTIKIRFNHSDLKKEGKTRNNFHAPSLKFAYSTFDKIAIVREGMEEDIRTHFEGIIPKNIQIVHNTNDIKNIIENSKKQIEFSESTCANYEIDEIKNILDDPNKIKLINIGRFSKEKGQIRLIKAFEKLQKENENAYLILIGGHGDQYDNITKLIKKGNIKNVIMIKDMENPLSILSKCQLFVLSSYYEGLPMTVMESLILNIPILSVNIEGPRKFLEQGYAYLVDNSEDGLYDGMRKFINNEYGELKTFDAEEFNKKAIKEFYNLLED